MCDVRRAEHQPSVCAVRRAWWRYNWCKGAEPRTPQGQEGEGVTTAPGDTQLVCREEKVDIRDDDGNVIGQQTVLVLECTSDVPILTIDLTGWAWDQQ